MLFFKNLLTLQPRDRGLALGAYYYEQRLIHAHRPGPRDRGGYRCSRPDPAFVNVGTFLAADAAFWPLFHPCPRLRMSTRKRTGCSRRRAGSQ